MFASRADLKVCSIGRPSRRVTAAEIHPRTLFSVYSSVRRASEMSVGGLTMTVSGGLREDNVREEAIRPSRRSGRDKARSPEFHGCEFPRPEACRSQALFFQTTVCDYEAFA